MIDNKSTEILLSGIDNPIEIDNYQEDQDRRQLMTIYESSSVAIREQMNDADFSDTYNILKTDITDMPYVNQKIFLGKYLDDMVKVYDYEFPSKPVHDTAEEIKLMFKFIEFVEFDNITLLKYVWKYLDDILTVNIRGYVNEHGDSIIDEITNQASLLVTLTENVSEFLRTYNKEGILEWFINRSERSKYEIYSENLD